MAKNKPAITSLSLLSPYRFRVFLAPLLKIIECITELAVPFLVRAVIDQGLTSPDVTGAYGAHYHETPYIYGLTSLIFVFALVGFSCTMVTQYLAAKVSSEHAYAVKEALYSRLMDTPSQSIEAFGKGKTLNLLTTDANSLQNGVQLFMRLMVRAPFLVVGSIVASFIINVYAGIAVLSALLLCAVAIFVILKVTPKRYLKLQEELDKLSTSGEDMIAGGRVMRAFNKQAEEKQAFAEESEKYRRMALRIARINSTLNPLTFAFIDLAIVLILYFGSFAYSSTALSVGSIVALISFLTQSLTALIQFTRLVTSISKAASSRKRIDSFFALPNPIEDGARERSEDPSAPIFEFQYAALSFGGEKNAVEGINLTLREGECIGIIGGTGSGKSTLLSLMERYYDPTEGSVYFRGSDLREWKLSAFRSQIALVSQKPQIFKGTLRDNLLLGNPEASEEEIAKAIKDSLCSEYFSHYEDGLDHQVEEGGANLSGGQKQRLLLARALLSSRPILLLDDATSALDYRSDAEVRKAIASRKGLSSVFVSQRATSLRHCDRIYVLDLGKIVGEGDHETLLKTCPVYREIYEAQVNAE